MPSNLHFRRPPLDDGPSRRRRLKQPRAHQLDERWLESNDHVTPMTALLFLAAAIALKQSVLAGGSNDAFIVGMVCLTLSLGSPLVSRLRARRRREARQPDHNHGR